MLRSNEPILLPMHAIAVPDANGFNLAGATGDIALFNVFDNYKLLEVGVVYTVAPGGTTTLGVISFDIRVGAGQDIGRIDGGGGTIDNDAQSPAPTEGLVYYRKIDQRDANLWFNLLPGMQVMVNLATAAAGTGAGGRFFPYAKVVYVPETSANLPFCVAAV